MDDDERDIEVGDDSVAMTVVVTLVFCAF